MSQLEQKTKKRKHHTGEDEPLTKRSKTAKEEKEKSKAKGKAKSKDKESKKDKGKGRADGQFSVVKASLAISIPPVFANDLRAGAEEMLDSMVMRYIPALQGVVLAHDNLQFLDAKATIKADCPFANCRIGFDATVWNPRVGMKLVGKVNLCSPDHVSLLIHRTFNVSIPRHHIPTDQWEFEYGPAENDPEFGAAADMDGAATAGANGDGEAAATEEQMEGSGRWVHKLTGAKLGAPDGYLEFTVIGLTIANEMLSLVGSIQPDPFSPDHVPDHSIISTTATSASRRRQQRATELEEAAVEDVLMPDDAGSEDEDAFGVLGRLGDEAAQKAEAEKKKKEKKRKHKEEKEATHDKEDASVEQEKKKKRKKTS